MSDLSIVRPLPNELRSRLFAAVKQHGEGPLAKALGLNRHTVVRGLSGLDLYGGSRAAIEYGLDAIDAAGAVSK